MDIQPVFLFYLLGINILTFVLMGTDKQKARKGVWRISERTFWIYSIAGGAAGSLIGMYTFRHKTKHRIFTIGMPLIIACQLIVFTFIADLS
jgi:uncharacterized membrane protein YsdA (DUF1294 family)